MGRFMSGRKARKRQRQIRKSFVARPRRYRRWHWYDWVFGLLVVAFLIYAIVSLIFASTWINTYRTDNTQTHSRNPEKPLSEMIRISYYHKIGMPLAIALLFAELYLILLMILVWIWLRYYRNFGYFVLVTVLVFLGIIFFLSIGSVATQKMTSPKAITAYAYDFVTEKLKEDNGSFSVIYSEKLKQFSLMYKCCGIRDYHDYRTWNDLIKWPTFNDSVPNACCIDHDPKSNVMSTLNECGNWVVLSLPPAAAQTKKINRHGCGSEIQNLISKGNVFLKFILHGFIIGLLLVIFFFLMLCLVWVLFGRLGHSKWDFDERNPNEQEDLVESDIIPGTPALSMLSESENTFYAP